MTPGPLDPEIAAALAELPVDVGTLLGGLSDRTIGSIRAAMGQMPKPDLSDQILRTDHEVPGSGGVVVRVHRQIGAVGALPCVYWMHGGGLVLGDFTGDDARFDRWCSMFGCVGVSVEYRLAPETTYPGALDDCYAGLTWVHANASTLGVDASRIGVGGPSAGAGLAAAVALLARDCGEIPIAYQLLVYPMLDDRQVTASSRWPDPVWPPSANAYGWAAYLGERNQGDTPAYAAPARALDLSGLPPTLIAVGAIDGFSDEDIAYAVRLRHAGVPVDLRVYAGAPHGFHELAPRSTVAQRATRDIEEWLGARLS